MGPKDAVAEARLPLQFPSRVFTLTSGDINKADSNNINLIYMRVRNSANLIELVEYSLVL